MHRFWLSGFSLIFILGLLTVYRGQVFAHNFPVDRLPEASETYLAGAVSIKEGSAPILDGKLTDPVWHTVPPVTGFVQRDPDYGEKAREDSEVRFCYDTENLYIGVRCYDSRPGRITKRLGYRERDMYGSDTFAVFIDSRHDHRTGVKFGTNALGMREDSSRYNDYLRDNSWDGIWWVKTSIDSLGWVAEFKIPFKNFRFVKQAKQIWGLNMQRNVQRNNETTFWKPISRDDGSINRMSKLGHLVGIEQIETGRRFEFVPFTTQGMTQHPGLGTRRETDLGLDVKYAITPNLTFDATANPDFAQVEADVDEINLTRFPTRFPEQRPFFVEGNSAFLTPTELFFSRRIGTRGDILWGTKVTGKSGPYTLGLLASQTGDWNYFGIQNRVPDKEEATYGVVRIKRDILGKSNAGFLFANKSMDGLYSRVLGVDFSLRPGDIYFFNGQVAATWNSGLGAQNRAFIFDFSRKTDLLSGQLSFRRLEPHFEVNEIGFLRKEPFRGSQRVRSAVVFSPRPDVWNLRQVFFTGWVDAEKSLPTEPYLARERDQNPGLNIHPEFVEKKPALAEVGRRGSGLRLAVARVFSGLVNAGMI